jgi:hypothetical protein
VESNRRHFVDYGPVFHIFPSFKVVKFLIAVEKMSIEEIEREIQSLPSDSIIDCFRAHFQLCHAIGDLESWSKLETNSIPFLVHSKHSSCRSMLRNCAPGVSFVHLRTSDWNRDYNFLGCFVAISDFLTSNSMRRIPEMVLVDCYSLLFLEKDRRYIFSFGDVLEKLSILRESCPEGHEFHSFIQRARERFLIVSEMSDHPVIEKVFVPTHVLFQTFLTDMGREITFY